VKEKEDFRVFVGSDIIEMANLALYAANKFHHTSDNPEEFLIHGTQVKAIAVPGLSRTIGLFGMRLSNMWIGTDLLSDKTSVEVWYEKKDQAVCYRNAFKYGVQVGVTKEVTKFIPA
jgi:hypothetical protein